MSQNPDAEAVGATPALAGARVPAAEPSLHELRPNAIGLLQSTVIAIASSAPGQATAISLAAIIAASAYGGGAAIIITTIPMLAIAFAYHRLNMWEQNCGASYVWVGRSISPYLGFMVGWIMLVGWILATVSDILPLGPAVLSVFGANPSSQWGTVISATILGVGVTVISVLGIKITARFQMVIAAIEYVILLIFSGIAIYAVFFAHWAGTVHPTLSWLSPNGVGGKGSLVGGALIAVYLFTGWDVAIYLNEETEKKERNPGLAAILSVIVLGLFYTLLVVALQGGAPLNGINANAASAMTYIAHHLVGSPWDKFMALAITLSVIGTTQAFLVGTARIAYAMGTDRLLPRQFGKVHQAFRTPVFGTVVFGVLTLMMTWLYVFSSSVSGAFDTVVASVGVLFAVFYAFTGIATTWYYRAMLRRSAGDVLLIGVLPLGGAAALLYIAVKSIIGFTGASLWSMVGIAVLGVAMMVVAALVYRSPFFLLRRVAYQPGGGTTSPEGPDDSGSGAAGENSR
jgi:amino acid transporter